MAEHIIKKGLDLPITGAPVQEVSQAQAVTHVGLVGHDYPNMKPRLRVQVGDHVKRGQPVFADRKLPDVVFTAPAAGEVVAIHRGEKRAFQSLVIKMTESEKAGQPTDEDFAPITAKIGKADELDGAAVRALLAETGLWTALRVRPFDSVPSPAAECAALFVTAVDTNPLTADPAVVLSGQEDAFKEGLKALTKLTEGKTFLCVGAGWKMSVDVAGVETHTFKGPHPAGLVGTHIHELCPVGRARTVWHIGYQDVAAIGQLLLTGKPCMDRVFAVAGPLVTAPRLVKSRVGASTTELLAGEYDESVEARVVSGSVVFGAIAGDEIHGYANRYFNQISVLAEGRERELFGWLAPGFSKYSTIRAFVSQWLPKSTRFAFNTTTHGSHRAMVPIGMFERVMPLDILPTFLLRSILVGDIERAEKLGALELGEEDLALCSFVSPGKEDYGVALRNMLTTIWKEG